MINLFQRRDLWRTRAFYLLLSAGGAAAAPFLNLFYLNLGLTGTQIGWIASIGAMVTLVAAPFWMSHPITAKIPGRLLQIFVILYAASFYLLSQQTLFLGIAAVVVFQALVGSAINPLTDALALNITRAFSVGFGSIRVFASIGWMVIVLITGWVVEQTELRIALIMAGSLLLISVLSLTHIAPENFSGDPSAAGTRLSLRALVNKLLHQPMMLGLAVMMLINGTMGRGVMQFEAAYLGELGARESLIGISAMLGTVVELPCMVLADHLLRRRSPYHLLFTSMLIYVGMRTFVFLFPSVPSILMAQLVHGACFSFYVIAVVRFIGNHTAPTETRLILAFFNVTLPSLTAIISSPLAGTLYDHFGARVLYAIAATGYLLSWMCLQFAARSRIKALEPQG